VLQPGAHAPEELRINRIAARAILSDDSAHSDEKRSDGQISRATMNAVTFFINDSSGRGSSGPFDPLLAYGDR
jgi:hypothetical protein